MADREDQRWLMVECQRNDRAKAQLAPEARIDLRARCGGEETMFAIPIFSRGIHHDREAAIGKPGFQPGRVARRDRDDRVACQHGRARDPCRWRSSYGARLTGCPLDKRYRPRRSASRIAGRLDLLDSHLGADGLDISVFPPIPAKK